MLITTSASPASGIEASARRLAEELSAVYVERGTHTLAQLMKRHRDPQILIAGDRDLKFKEGTSDIMAFHPSMAMIRVKRLAAGERDTMLEASRAAAGDVVIDCTMGLASDAVVFAAAVGDKGQVYALESELVPYVLAREGLRHYSCGFPELEAAMRRVIPIYTDHLDYLRRQPDKSADIVYFDPMFRRSKNSSAIEPLRPLAKADALSLDAVEEALRVARKSVVMKEHNRSGEFERLGFRPYHAAHSKITYGVKEL